MNVLRGVTAGAVCLATLMVLGGCEKPIKPIAVSLGDTVSKRPSSIGTSGWIEDGRRWITLELHIHQRTLREAREKLNISLLFTDCSGNDLSISEIWVGGSALGFQEPASDEFETFLRGLPDRSTRVIAYMEAGLLTEFDDVCGYLRAGDYLRPWKSPEFPIVFSPDADFSKRPKRPAIVCDGQAFCARANRNLR